MAVSGAYWHTSVWHVAMRVRARVSACVWRKDRKKRRCRNEGGGGAGGSSQSVTQPRSREIWSTVMQPRHIAEQSREARREADHSHAATPGITFDVQASGVGIGQSVPKHEHNGRYISGSEVMATRRWRRRWAARLHGGAVTMAEVVTVAGRGRQRRQGSVILLLAWSRISLV